MGPSVETIGTIIAFVLTLMVYCYLGKDIPFFHSVYRSVASMFVGVALAYSAIMAWHSVLVPRLWLRLEGGQWWYIVPLVLCLLLLARAKRSWAMISGISLAFLFGVGAALAIGGGMVGTLVPQVRATLVSLNPADYQVLADREGSSVAVHVLNAALILVGTISTLMYFTFTSRRPASTANDKESRAERVLRGVGTQAVQLATGFGKVFLMFTFGALFATTAISRISLLADRIRFIIETVWSWIPAF